MITLSMVLRLLTFAVVINYYKVSRLRTAWLLIAAAMVLLSLENLFQLLALRGISQLASGSVVPHAAGLTVSVLMLTGTVLINTILKRLDTVERTKKSVEKNFQMLFDTTSDQILLLDTNGKIVEANHAVCQRLELSRNQLLSLHFADLKSGPHVEGVLDHINRIQNGSYYIFETELRSKTGQRFPVEINCSLIDIEAKPYIACVARTIAERKELDKKVRIAIIETEETERRRFAKEIHDGLGPLLSTIKLYVNELDGAKNTHEKEESILFINKLVDEAVDSARNIANNITPQLLTDYGLTKAIVHFTDAINATNLLQIKVRCSNIDRQIGPTLELIFYRIITELINNTIKHANANIITIDFRLSDHKLVLDYRDDGIGFDLQQAIEKGDNHMGVKNIISRVRSMNGTFNFQNTNPGIHIYIAVDTLARKT
ncbi:MAG: PAS domain S-box protein [Bacteroidales bacterium]|jgi:PAS domain S-box-containing protein|nr:PAS domain S-box protein [Bacteroidales bacterium]